MIKTTFLFLTTLLTFFSNHQCVSNAPVSGSMDDLKEVLYRDLSPETYFTLPFHESPDLRRKTKPHRTNTHDAYIILKPDFEKERLPSMPPAPALRASNSKTYSNIHLCFAISYMWRRGRKSIHRFYNLRDTYFDHLPFEIGYVTQTIMAKYQNVLELYEYSTRMADDNLIGTPHLYFLYKTLLGDCTAIIHLCNMIHEITRKYRIQQVSSLDVQWSPVEYNPDRKFQDPAGNYYKDTILFWGDTRPTRGLERGVEGHEHEKYRHEKNPSIIEGNKAAKDLVDQVEERRNKVLKQQREIYNSYGSFAMTSPTRRSKRWRSNEPNIYGWEPEDIFNH